MRPKGTASPTRRFFSPRDRKSTRLNSSLSLHDALPISTATCPSSLSFSVYMLLILSTHPIAAIDIERLGDDIIAIGRSQENRRTNVILRQTHASERNGLANEALLFPP